MKFVDNEHRQFYEDTVRKAGATGDCYREALFYVLGMLPDTRRWIDDIYNFDEKIIKTSALKKPWQTSGNMRVTRMAFNLYNGFNGIVGNRKIDDPVKYSPYWLFDTSNTDYFLEAIRLLNGVYKHKTLTPSVEEFINKEAKKLGARADQTR